MSSLKHILIIDDDTVNNMVCSKLMNIYDENIKITEFTFAPKALSYFEELAANQSEKGTPDLIILDLNMPLMSGWQFLDYFQELNLTLKKPIPVVLLTSSELDNDLRRAKKYPVIIEFVSKPLTLDALLSIKQTHFADDLNA